MKKKLIFRIFLAIVISLSAVAWLYSAYSVFEADKSLYHDYEEKKCSHSNGT